jgi:hypothetical protein
MNRIGRRTIYAVLVIVVLLIVWRFGLTMDSRVAALEAPQVSCCRRCPMHNGVAAEMETTVRTERKWS